MPGVLAVSRSPLRCRYAWIALSRSYLRCRYTWVGLARSYLRCSQLQPCLALVLTNSKITIFQLSNLQFHHLKFHNYTIIDHHFESWNLHSNLLFKTINGFIPTAKTSKDLKNSADENFIILLISCGNFEISRVLTGVNS